MQPGVWGVLATPFSGSTLDLDDNGLAQLVEHADAAGVNGLTVLGVFGEAAKLSWAERRQVLETVLDTIDLPLVVGCTSLATAPVIDEAAMAVEQVGDRLAGVMVQANSAERTVLDTHLRAVHEATWRARRGAGLPSGQRRTGSRRPCSATSSRRARTSPP